MDCSRAVDLKGDRGTLAGLETAERFAFLLHIRRCSNCREAMTAEEFVKSIEVVISVRD